MFNKYYDVMQNTKGHKPWIHAGISGTLPYTYKCCRI